MKYFLKVNLFKVEKGEGLDPEEVIGESVYSYQGIIPVERMNKLFKFIVKIHGDK